MIERIKTFFLNLWLRFFPKPCLSFNTPVLIQERKRYPNLSGNSHQRRIQRRLKERKA